MVDVALVWYRPVVGSDKAGGALYPAADQVSVNSLKNVYAAQTALGGSVTHRQMERSLILSCTDSDVSDGGSAVVDWTLAADELEQSDSSAVASSEGTGVPYGFCRGYALLDDDQCYDCAGVTPEERELSGAPRFCSWCFEYSAKFTLTKINKTSRDEWECTMCGGVMHCCQQGSDLGSSLGVSSAACRNMARGGVSNTAGFGRMRCDRHRLGHEVCDAIMAKMPQMDDEFHRISTDVDAMRAELTRPTEQLKLATDAGMLRPFLCLVAMGWRQRRSLAMQLGWSLPESEHFGDPHGEAWELISKAGAGVQSRATQSYEKINPGAEAADWDEVLHRVCTAAFGCSRHVPSTDVADPVGKLKRPLKEIERQKIDRAARLKNPLETRVREMEDEVWHTRSLSSLFRFLRALCSAGTRSLSCSLLGQRF